MDDGTLDDLIRKVEIVLYTEAQRNQGKFKNRELIRYSIKEVCDILRENKDYLMGAQEE